MKHWKETEKRKKVISIWKHTNSNRALEFCHQQTMYIYYEHKENMGCMRYKPPYIDPK